MLRSTKQETDLGMGRAGERSDHTGSGSDPAALPLDEEELDRLSLPEMFDLLRNERRVYVLRFLQLNDDGQYAFDTVVTQVAAWENDTSTETVTGSERHRTYTSLRQTHLPKLDEAAVIQFDKRRGEIAVGEEFDRVAALLEYALRVERSRGDPHSGEHHWADERSARVDTSSDPDDSPSGERDPWRIGTGVSVPGVVSLIGLAVGGVLYVSGGSLPPIGIEYGQVAMGSLVVVCLVMAAELVFA